MESEKDSQGSLANTTIVAAEPVFSDMRYLDLRAKLKGMGLSTKVQFLKVYVDDIITALPKEGIEIVLKTFSMINEKIQLTIEIEDNGTLPFLDVRVKRNEDKT
ncbi:hypothetical protein M0804_013737 [Polistes exclamans]|nr:hypothetical protein M0804_013737 [Polistes exclamans]